MIDEIEVRSIRASFRGTFPSSLELVPTRDSVTATDTRLPVTMEHLGTDVGYGSASSIYV